jgi:hypothetical protein
MKASATVAVFVGEDMKGYVSAKSFVLLGESVLVSLVGPRLRQAHHL